MIYVSQNEFIKTTSNLNIIKIKMIIINLRHSRKLLIKRNQINKQFLCYL